MPDHADLAATPATSASPGSTGSRGAESVDIGIGVVAPVGGALTEALYLAHDGLRPQHGLVRGPAGSGKTELLTTIAHGLRNAVGWRVMVGLNSSAAGSPLTQLGHHVALGADNVLTQLRMLEVIVAARYELAAQGQLTDHAMGEGAPPRVQWIIDDVTTSAPTLTATTRRADLDRRLLRLVVLGPAVGVAIAISGTSSRSFTHNQPLLDLLTTANDITLDPRPRAGISTLNGRGPLRVRRITQTDLDAVLGDVRAGELGDAGGGSGRPRR